MCELYKHIMYALRKRTQPPRKVLSAFWSNEKVKGNAKTVSLVPSGGWPRWSHDGATIASCNVFLDVQVTDVRTQC